MDRLIQMGKDLGYEGEKLQDFVKQQKDYERGERIAERELERDRIAAQEKDRETELARIAAEEAKADKERELERDRIAAQEKDRETELARIAAEVAEIVEVREVILITAERMSKERRLSLKKANPVEVVVIHVVAVEDIFVVVVRPTVHHVVADIK